jgi:photosystem II stability/assembly factor-like uncharacterized protein
MATLQTSGDDSPICEGKVFRVQLVDRNNGFTHTQHELLRTSDAGKTWQVGHVGNTQHYSVGAVGVPNSTRAAGTGSQATIDDFCFMDLRHGWLVEDSVLYSTSDAGRTWKKHAFDSIVVRSVWFTTPRNGFFVGEQLRRRSGFAATVYATIDGGRTWRRRYAKTQDGAVFWHVVGISKSLLLALGDPTLVTRDGGLTWRELDFSEHMPTGQSFFGVPSFARVVDSRRAFIYTNQGDRYLATENGGQTWKVLVAACPSTGASRP